MIMTGKRRLPAAALLGFGLAFGMAGFGHAQETARPLGVVELFTSQGCNSCPPADKVLSELADRDDVIALSYHVDYWDYLGWKDGMASPDNTERQQTYAHSLERASVYTPQAIINGQRDVNGARRDTVLSTLDGLSGGTGGLPVTMALHDTGDSIVIDAGDMPAANGTASLNAHVLLIDFTARQSVAIRSGENGGKTFEYRNAVKRIQTVGMWNGQAKSIELPKSEMMKKGDGCAVLLQAVDKKGRLGPILGAAMTRP
ncbi:hypothetical protein NA8A_14389 [Nitratireductor indicus C115]|uniref:DUF1223 domain-containing protein n=1 Tax=Nitratireductor indicus C115 TaxID=1231190 RepID=K2N317_9HYPH|nr:DUF1223 domain-containing protein [Nitratireductor indicus]EKF41813.1 hypothetical protein NA8A_14389 [Nitratireductor indicus C115]SFQ67035.1 hypothetical protein SAMN05216176_10967 [Nitratireductor indicus]